MNNAPTMARPHEYTSLWWPEERITATLDTKYIISRLRPESVPQLFDLPRWGEGLTSETYMERIMTKAGRLFLILNEIGIPDRIFALVDESRDDDDLPMAEQNIDLLCLSPYGNDPTLDASFFHAQWRFLVRGISEGEHVAYTANEGVPVEVARATTSSGVQGRDETVDKVVLSGTVCRVFLRTRVQVGGAPHFFSSDEVLEEIRSLRKLAHQHLFSIYASYFVDDTVCVLFTGAETDRTLQSFLSDEPLTFKRLPKEERRQTLITWPHCLVSALSWLHVRGHSHTAIRPSNILVDPDFNIILGQFQALDSLLAPPRVNDLESYQYSAPERWIHTATAPIHPVQQAPSKVILPSGGRTGRRKKPVRLCPSTTQRNWEPTIITRQSSTRLCRIQGNRYSSWTPKIPISLLLRFFIFFLLVWRILKLHLHKLRFDRLPKTKQSPLVQKTSKPLPNPITKIIDLLIVIIFNKLLSNRSAPPRLLQLSSQPGTQPKPPNHLQISSPSPPLFSTFLPTSVREAQHPLSPTAVPATAPPVVAAEWQTPHSISPAIQSRYNPGLPC
ncbi:hypothetical protein N7481_004179 [Penicillium waksmanii]|uniref:uncharacterized protein n=1 Tax=Penicillium waksmanii TaxID=69791 RepID=UPI0025481255|nr:uncharacterized protein N7481_004179 [Penicillium waksmanii]KAJ5988969.1 hypothetical protein N7481_004179 [Penicillium waksmanii]